jgi:hypothetical protein
MGRKPFILVAIVAALGGVPAGAPSAIAQGAPNLAVGEPPVPVLPRSPPRIVIHPAPLLYRRCVGWYEMQYRPSGPVLFPGKHCWWVRGY